MQVVSEELLNSIRMETLRDAARARHSDLDDVLEGIEFTPELDRHFAQSADPVEMAYRFFKDTQRGGV